MLKTVVTAVCFCICDVAVGAPVALSNQALSEMIGGSVVELDTPLGTKLAISYGDDGRMTGHAGALSLYLGASRDKGKWWVASDQLCQKWETWFDRETQCMRIQKDGSRINWASRDGKSGTGTVQLRVAAAPAVARPAAKTAASSPAVSGPSVGTTWTAKTAAPAVVVAQAKPPRVVVSPSHALAKVVDKPVEKRVEVAAEIGPSAAPAIAPVETVAPTTVQQSTVEQSLAPMPQPKPQFSRLTMPLSPPMALGRVPEFAAVDERAAPAPSHGPGAVTAAGVAAAGVTVGPKVAPAVTPGVQAKVINEAKPSPKIEAPEVAEMQRSAKSAGTAASHPVSPTPDEPVFRVVNVRRSDVLNVREGPSEEHGVVGAIPPRGHGVAMTGACRSQWCPVRHQDVSGWVNRTYLESEEGDDAQAIAHNDAPARDSPDAPRGCLSFAAKDLLGRIEAKFGPVQLVSTCRPGATIAGTGRPSRHRDGNAIDFNAGARKQAVVEWLIANHAKGGTMTYRDMEHVHVDIGPHFVALASGARSTRDWSSERMGLAGRR